MKRKGDGLYLRGKTWYLDARINGQRYRVKLGKNINRSVAAELASIERAKFLKDEAGIGRKKKDVPFDVARQHFERWAAANKKPNTVKSYKECLRRLAESFSGKRLSEISAFAVEGHKQRRIKAGALVRVNRELAVLRHLFNQARVWGLYQGDNPLDAVKHVNEPKRRERYLSQEEEAVLLAASPEPYRSLFLVCLNTGLRMESEALTLRWDAIDFKRRLLTVESGYAKNGKGRVVPMNRLAREALLLLNVEAKGQHVFAKPNGEPLKGAQHVFKAACQRAGLLDVVPHTLRHTWASRLVETGCDLRMLMELGGWSSLHMVERYSHVNPTRKAEAVEKLAAIPHMVHHTRETASSCGG